MKLERGRIVAVALDLLSRDGLEALSLRKIADAFGVQTPALYWHIADRRELISLMAGEMMRESVESMRPELTGAPCLMDFGRALHACHMRRRDAAKLIALAAPSEIGRAAMNSVIEKLVDGGMEREKATEAQAAIQAFTLGWSLFKANPPVDREMVETMDVDAAFKAGLSALAGGFFLESR